MPRRPTITRRQTAAALIAIGALLGAATAVNALSANGASQYSQGAGVDGSAEVGDYFGGALAIGDFDNDGRGDLIAGAPFEDFGSKADVGVVHVLSGTSSGLSTDDDISIHQGTRGVPGAAERNDRFGSALAVGDFDNDGYDDVVVGTDGEDTKTKTDVGGFTILYGSKRGLRGDRSRTFTAATKGVKGPAEAHANLGAAVAVGDFDGDQYDDVAIGAPGSGKGERRGAGAVHILYGSPRGIRPAGDQRIHQSKANVAGTRNAGDGFGSSLAVGDFNRDGRDDLAVGIPGEAADGFAAAGAVQVFSGSKNGIRLDTGTLITQASGDLATDPGWDEQFGSSLAAGDFDGNKRDDLAIGSPGEGHKNRDAVGRVHVLYGSNAGLRLTGTDSFNQGANGIDGKNEAGDGFGSTLAAADFNNNGRLDLAIGAPGEARAGLNGAGTVHVVFGTTNGVRLKRHQEYWPGHAGIPGSLKANGGFGRALATGDIDGDGRADLVAAAPGQKVRGDANAGTMIVIFG